MKFRDEAAECMTIVCGAETKELAESLAAAETSMSQAPIAWDRHEKLSEQLKAVQSDLAKAKEAHAREESNFRNHRRGNDEILLQMHSWSSKIVDALSALKVKGLPALPKEHSYSLRCYPSFLELVASRFSGLKGSVSRSTLQEGRVAARQVATQFVAALR